MTQSFDNTAQRNRISHYYRMKSRFAERDAAMNLVKEVRDGNMRMLFPEHLSETLGVNGTAVANYVDVFARDLAEVSAPLPALDCASGAMKSEADKKRAERKNRIGDWYWRQSHLDLQMLVGQDNFITYGLSVYFVEPDRERKLPFIQIEDPRGCYYELDRFGYVKNLAKMWWRTIDELVAEFPEFEGSIKGPNFGNASMDPNRRENGDTRLELVRWVDDQSVIYFLPAREGMIVNQYDHRLGVTPAHVQVRPGLSGHARGQFDDSIYVQLAQAMMAQFSLDAAEQAVTAPLQVPLDVQDLPEGPNAVIQTDGVVKRVGIEVPPSAFQENQFLENEMKVGSRFPDMRLGNTNASVVTGRGVQALMGGYDTQLRAIQQVTQYALRRVTSIAFMMDEKWFGGVSKTIQGTISGRSYEVTYRPRDAISGNHECDVTYGFAAGLAPTQSSIMMLQLLGAGLIAKDTIQRNLPFDIDPQQEQQESDQEQMRDALRQGLLATMQQMGAMVQAGQDPTGLLTAAAAAIKARGTGTSIEDAVSQAFQQMQQAAQEAQAKAQADAQAAQAAQAGAGGAPAPGGPDVGGPQGGETAPDVLPGQAPGGMQSIQNLVAGFRGSGSTPVMQATVSRRPPVAG